MIFYAKIKINFGLFSDFSVIKSQIPVTKSSLLLLVLLFINVIFIVETNRIEGFFYYRSTYLLFPRFQGFFTYFFVF